jgi:putative ABC transport system permease protein
LVLGIIIKFIFKNIWEKKLRTLLVLFSICLSTALLFSSLGISDNVAEVYLKQIRSQIGESELIIYAGQDAPSRYFSTARAEIFKHDLEYTVGIISETGSYKISPRDQVMVSLQGLKLEDLQKMNPLTLQEQYGLYPFKGNKIIISRLTADKYELNAGDKLDVKIKDNLHRFTIAAIAAPKGILMPGTDSFSAVVPLETLCSIIGERGKVSQLYIKTKNPLMIQQVKADLQKQYPRYEITQTITDKELKEYTQVIRVPFLLMLILVVLISIFVIYTAFKVIAFERMPVMGTFRSIGATQKRINLLLLSESISYGVIGGALGCLLGIGLLYGMTYSMAMNPWDPAPPEVDISFSYLYMGISFVSAVVLSVGSSLIPIIRISKVPLRDIILNTYTRQDGIKTGRTRIALVLLILSLVVPRLVKDELAGVLGSLSIITATVAVVWLIPHIMDFFILFYQRFFSRIFGNEGILALKNIYRSKDMLNNITLLTIGLASLLLINTISFSVTREVAYAYSDFRTDIIAYMSGADRKAEASIKSVKGVESVLGFYERGQVEIAGIPDIIGSIFGIDGSRMADFIDFRLQGDEAEMLQKFAAGRTIIPSSFLKRKMELKEGDFLTLKTVRGDKKYQIIGFSDTILNNGNTALIHEKYMKNDWELKYYSTFWINASGDPAAVSKALQDKLIHRDIYSITMDEMEENNEKSNNQLLFLLQGFSLVTMVIGVFGVFNNIVVSLLTRKRYLAVFRSIGMSQRQMVKVLLTEALAGGLIAGFTGIVIGLIYLVQTGQLLFLLNLPIRMHYPPQYFITAVLAGAVISVLATLLPSRQTARLDIVRELKYE